MSNIHDLQQAEPLALAIDTSSQVAGYAIARGDRVLASLTVNADKPHSQTFFPTIDALCSLASVAIQEVALFAAVSGPGSFTGLRVGLSAAKGLADSLGKPCVGVNALDLLAVTSRCNGLCLITIGAGRREIFCGLRRVNADGQVEAVGEDRISTPLLVLNLFPIDPLSATLVSDCELALEEGIGWPAADRIVRVERRSANLASTLAVIASRQAQAGGLAPLTAYYIRPADAEIKKKATT